MSRNTVIVRRIEILGYIWIPNTLAAMEKKVDAYDVEHMRSDDGSITRDSVQRWLDTHVGDFSHIVDFHADIDDVDIPWRLEDNELQYNELTYPE